ncbi:MAG TPA: ABC-three component system middle component 6 [Gemmataceae bacterium]|nr:ABC-three component system middle component 6 [Gemmataceae bacterium]
MILPTKRLGQDRALLAVGGEILGLLGEPKTVSRVWEEFKQGREDRPDAAPITFDWFVLALDLLHAMRVVEWERGRLRKALP